MYPELGKTGRVCGDCDLWAAEVQGASGISFKELYQALADSPKPVVLCIKQNFPERYKKKNGLAGGNMMTAFKSLGCVGVISDLTVT